MNHAEWYFSSSPAKKKSGDMAPPAIIVRFTNLKARNNVYRMRRGLKGCPVGQPLIKNLYQWRLDESNFQTVLHSMGSCQEKKYMPRGQPMESNMLRDLATHNTNQSRYQVKLNSSAFCRHSSSNQFKESYRYVIQSTILQFAGDGCRSVSCISESWDSLI